MSPPDTPSSRFAATEIGGPPSAAAVTAGPAVTPLSYADPKSVVHVAPPDELLGTTLRETYVIERVLGEGGMGRVYLASHTRIKNKRFAIKTLHPEFMRNKEAVARFFREAEAAALIPSPNVVGVVDVDRVPDGRPFIVSEYLEGEDLSERLKAHGGGLSVPLSVSIVRQVCRGLAAAHAYNIVHRDIKPENVFLIGPSAHPVAKVLDFGISRLDEPDSASLTKTGSILGTPAYMAPEQARGEQVDARTDVYATGALLYVSLTGQVPFARDNPSAMLAAVLLEEPVRPRTLVASIPQALEAVIQRAMAKRPSERYGTIQELAHALAPFDILREDEAAPGSAGAAPLDAKPGARASGHAAEAEARSVGEARPALLVLIALAVVVFLTGLLTALEGALRSADVELTGLQVTMLLGGVAATLTTPIWLLVRHVRRDVWANVLHVLELGRRIRAPLTAGFVAMGAAALLVRFVEAVLLGRAGGAAWPMWDAILFGLGVTVAAWTALRSRAAAAQSAKSGYGLKPLAVSGVCISALVLAVSVGRDETSIDASTAQRGRDGDDTPAAEGSDERPGAAGSAKPTAKRKTDPARLAKLRRTVVDRGEARVFGEALDAAQELFELSEDAEKDRAVREVVRQAALQPGDIGARAQNLMAYSMGSAGSDMLYELSARPSPQQAEAKRLLSDPAVRAHGTVAFRIAYELRAAKGCTGKMPLVSKAERHGDARSAQQLEPLTRGAKRGCGLLGLGSCPPPCGATNTTKIRAAVHAIRARAAKLKKKK